MAAGAHPVAAPERSLTADVDALLAHVTSRTRLVFLANPNNPTGSYLTGAELQRLRAGLPADVILVIDAAYAEYATAPDYDSGLELARATPNTVTMRTFSKLFGLAALRLGWMSAAPAHRRRDEPRARPLQRLAARPRPRASRRWRMSSMPSGRAATTRPGCPG